jgi:hypothetical protein
MRCECWWTWAEVEASAAGGVTPLHDAAYRGQVAVVKTLVLELGAEQRGF